VASLISAIAVSSYRIGSMIEDQTLALRLRIAKLESFRSWCAAYGSETTAMLERKLTLEITPNPEKNIGLSLHSGKQHKLIGLEIIRFICAISIMIYHYPIFWFVGANPVGLIKDQLPFYKYLYWLYERGQIAVPYFWCISGFIFFWKYLPLVPDKVSGFQFFVLRFSRLYPLHFATLITVLLLQVIHTRVTGTYFTYVDNTLLNFVLHLMMMGNWTFPKNVSFNGPIWSVSIEVAVYVSFYFLCRTIRRADLAALVIAAIAIPVYLNQEGSIQIISCIAFFYLGGSVCFAFLWIDKSNLRIPTFSVLAAGFAWLWLAGGQPPVSGYAYLILTSSCTVLAAVCLPLPRWRLCEIAGSAGNLTYSAYLLHFPLMLAIVTTGAAVDIEVPRLSRLFFIIFYAGVLLISVGCYRFFERPAQSGIRKIMLRLGIKNAVHP
jgi:peptidoglycan/LPS O-acetylase OafA/YrhL